MKGATLGTVQTTDRLSSFNPRSHEGSDIGFCSIQKILHVSIHAPMKGATVLQFFVMTLLLVSIHAPMKGATCWDAKNRYGLPVSIHAPMKGATAAAFTAAIVSRFQSTLP